MTSAAEPNIAASTARVRLIVWCKECQRHVEPDPVKIAERHDKLVCSSVAAGKLTWSAAPRADEPSRSPGFNGDDFR